jgi:exosortase A-associated hydrolase 2
MDALNATPGFFQASAGALFGFQVTPVEQPRALALYLPPHGEEMNRCRTLMADQARALAAKGIACTVLDYYGTGDSEGAFSAATWDIWQADIASVITQLQQRHGPLPVMLAGLRLGALVALDFANRQPGGVTNLLLIQPVSNGNTYITQLLRQRMAYLMSNELPVESTQELRDRINRGEALEIGGYLFGSELLQTVDAKQMKAMTAVENMDITWMEQVSEPGKDVTAGSHKGIAQLQAQNNRVRAVTFCDPPLWQLHERDTAPQAVSQLSAMEFAWP